MATKKSTAKKSTAKKAAAKPSEKAAPEATETQVAVLDRPLDKHELYQDSAILDDLNKVYDEIGGQLDKHNDLVRYHLVQIQGEIESLRNAFVTSRSYARPGDA